MHQPKKIDIVPKSSQNNPVMKPIYSYALLAAFAAVGSASAVEAVTTPVGYVTQTLSPEKYNLVSLTMQNPSVASGVITAEDSAFVATTGVDFTAILTPGTVYILELPDGTIQEISSWSATQLDTPNDLTGVVTPNTTTYVLRKADTISTVFGATNSAGLAFDADDDYTNNDLVLVPNASNAFDTVYYFDDGAGTSGWFTAAGDPADNLVLNYADGFFVQRGSGSDITLTVDGEVKKVSTKSVLVPGFNFVGSVSPAGLTLANSGLQNSLTISVSEETTPLADLVLKQNPDGSYRSVYYFNDGAGTTGWFDLAGDPADDLALDTGFLIQNLGATKPYEISAPSFYTTL